MTENPATTSTETAVEQETPVEQGAVAAPRLGDWAIAGAMLVIFVGGYVLAQAWPFRAALFPQGIALFGAALSVFKLVGLAMRRIRSNRGTDVAVAPSPRAADLPAQPMDSTPEGASVRTAAVAGEEEADDPSAQPAETTIVDDEQESDESIEYIFSSASGRDWASALAWIVTFFVAFFVLGAYITVPLFALVYLTFSGHAKWWAALLYAVVSGAVIYVVFRDVVFIPLPESVFPFLDF